MTTISIGKLNDEQEAVVRRFVMGYNVHDIGSGQLGLAQKLIEFGAHTVTAIDRMYSRQLVHPPHPNIMLVGEYFEEYAAHGHYIDVAFASWPEAYHQDGIVSLVRGARTVIYLGSNFDGVACGSVEFFQHLSHRNVLAVVPQKYNSLIVYGNSPSQNRRLLPEEYAALNRNRSYFTFGEDLAL